MELFSLLSWVRTFVGNFSFYYHCLCNFLYFLSLSLFLSFSLCPWLCVVPEWLLYFSGQFVSSNQRKYRTVRKHTHSPKKKKTFRQYLTVFPHWIRYNFYVFINRSRFILGKKKTKKRQQTEAGEERAEWEQQRRRQAKGWRTVESKQGNGRWKLEDVKGFSGSDWLSLWSQVFIIPSCDALISPFFCTA